VTYTELVTAVQDYLETTFTDFLSAYSLAIIDANNEYHYLLNKDVNFIREAYPKTLGTGLGRPKHYAIFGPTVNGGVISNNLSFILGPTPDAIYGVELHYFYYPESIVDANTSWLGENFDSVLLNATLYEGSTFLKLEQDLVALAKDRYVQSIALLKNLGDGKQRMDAYRDGQVRVQVS